MTHKPTDMLNFPRFTPLLTSVTFSCILTLATDRHAVADQYVLTIGGGYAPSGNQASLEKNVLLFNRVLSAHAQNSATARSSATGSSLGSSVQSSDGDSSDGAPTDSGPSNGDSGKNRQTVRHDVLFADGRSPKKDLQVHDIAALPEANRLMAEFFGSTRDLGLTYRNHQVPDVRDASTPDNLKAWFTEVGPHIGAGDQLTIYVTAHGNGSRDKDNDYETTIAMWGNTKIRMTEFAKLLDTLDPQSSVVVVMVQCYTGGFSHMMFTGGDPSKGLAPQSRIGFFATVHDRPAAGCTPSVDEADYVEYSTYFWAAVSGRDRLGKVIERPDYDGDGKVSLEEAHAYTVLNADTIDVPVKTSGEFLSEVSRFANNKDDDSDPQRRLYNNDEDYSLVLRYASPVQRVVLERLSKKLKLSGERRLVDAWEKTQENRRRRRSSSSSAAKNRIASDMRRRWPELANTMNPVSIELVTSRSSEFVKAITGHSQYKKFLSDKRAQENRPDEQATRAQYERFLRVADNVMLAENLRRLDRPERLQQYERMVASERQSLLAEDR